MRMKAPVFKGERGATFVEVIIAISIMGIALVPLTLSFSYTSSRSADSMIEVRVVEVGQAYLEEILNKRFDENSSPGGSPPCSASTTPCGTIGPEAGETRATYDDVDDFAGIDDQPPVDSLGNARAGYDRFRVEVDVDYASASEVTEYGLDSATDLKRVLVTVHPPVGNPSEFEVYRGNF